MARYIENLNTCSDPTSGDYLWVVDASAGATDKDRKVDAGLFAQLAVANTFSASQIINKASPVFTMTPTTGISALLLQGADNGANWGSNLLLGRNTNASTPAAGFLQLTTKSDVVQKVWADAANNLRIGTTLPTSAQDTSGTVVGTQTSSLDTKDVIEGVTDIADVLAAVQRGAEAVRRFTYKSGAFNGEEFEGVVVDYAPRYGMDKDAEHEAGKSLNMVNAIGDLLRAVAWLVEREQVRA